MLGQCKEIHEIGRRNLPDWTPKKILNLNLESGGIGSSKLLEFGTTTHMDYRGSGPPMVNVIPLELKMRITKVYTRGGDKGETSLVGGARIPKDNPRIEAYGTVDELNSILGLVRAFDPPSRIDEIGAKIQNDLFNVGTDLATPAGKRWEGMYRVGDVDVQRLEAWIDELNADLEPLREFILPGGGACGAFLHQARTVCRRAERRVMTLMGSVDDVDDGSLRYLNRLSDFLFVAARWSAREQGAPETFWKQPNAQD